MLCARRYRILVRLERQVPKRKHLFSFDKIMTLRHCVRAAQEMDSKSIGLCPQGFESPRCRLCYYLVVPCCFPTLRQQGEASSSVERDGFQDGARFSLRMRNAFKHPLYLHRKPAIAQLAEHLTVEIAGIRWSLVRFRVDFFVGVDRMGARCGKWRK